MRKILFSAGTGLEKTLRAVIVFLGIIILPAMAIIALPEVSKVDWSKDVLTFVIIIVVCSIPFLYVFLTSKESSIKNVIPNLKRFVNFVPSEDKPLFPTLKLFTVIFGIIIGMQILLFLTMSILGK